MAKKIRTEKTRAHISAVRLTLALIREIRDERSYPNTIDLAKRFKRSRRTIARLIRALRRGFGAPIRYDAGQNGYYFTDRRGRLDS